MEKIIYLASVINNFNVALVVVFGCTLLLSLLAVIGNVIEGMSPGDGIPLEVVNGRKVCRVALILCILVCLIPSREEMNKIIAVHIGEEIVNNGEVKDISKKSLKLLDTWIDREMRKLEE